MQVLYLLNISYLIIIELLKRVAIDEDVIKIYFLKKLLFKFSHICMLRLAHSAIRLLIKIKKLSIVLTMII